MLMREKKNEFEFAMRNLTDYEKEEIKLGKNKVMTGMYLESLELEERIMTLFDGIVEGGSDFDDKYLATMIRDAFEADTDGFDAAIGSVINNRIVSYLAQTMREKEESLNA